MRDSNCGRSSIGRSREIRWLSVTEPYGRPQKRENRRGEPPRSLAAVGCANLQDTGRWGPLQPSEELHELVLMRSATSIATGPEPRLSFISDDSRQGRHCQSASTQAWLVRPRGPRFLVRAVKVRGGRPSVPIERAQLPQPERQPLCCPGRRGLETLSARECRLILRGSSGEGSLEGPRFWLVTRCPGCGGQFTPPSTASRIRRQTARRSRSSSRSALGPSERASSGSGWTSRKGRRSRRRPPPGQVGDHLALAGGCRPARPAAGSWTEWVASKTTGAPGRLHLRDRAEVVDQPAVAERRPALGQEHPGGADGDAAWRRRCSCPRGP